MDWLFHTIGIFCAVWFTIIFINVVANIDAIDRGTVEVQNIVVIPFLGTVIYVAWLVFG